MDNLDVSVAALKKLTEDWRQLSVKQSSLDGLGDTLKSFRQKVMVLLYVCVCIEHVVVHASTIE